MKNKKFFLRRLAVAAGTAAAASLLTGRKVDRRALVQSGLAAAIAAVAYSRDPHQRTETRITPAQIER